MIAGTSGGVDDAKRAAVLLQPANRPGGSLRRWLPSSVNVVRSTFASSPSFTNVKPEVGIPVQMRLADLVEDRHAAEVVAALEEHAE